MVSKHDLLPILVSVALVIASAVAVVGGTALLAGTPVDAGETVPDSSDLQQYGIVTERSITAVWNQLGFVSAPFQWFFAHPTELLLVFELGLLVEHLRLLNQMDHNLVNRLDRSPTDTGEEK